MELYRVTKDSPKWQRVSYDYIRLDAFCVGQRIPVEAEFNGDAAEDTLNAVILVDEHRPVSGCRIAWVGSPEEGFAQIQRVATVREKQKQGFGAQAIAEAERWIAERGYHHILITSQDRSVGFYNAIGYKTLPDEKYFEYFPEERERKQKRLQKIEEERAAGIDDPFSFTTVLVEKYI